MEAMTDLIKVALPAVVTYFSCPIGSLLAMLSTMYWKSPLLRWCTESGRPNQYIGKLERIVGNPRRVALRSISEHRIGTTILFRTFPTSPVTSLKSQRMRDRLSMSSLIGATQMIGSSAKREVRMEVACPWRRCKSPFSVALARMACRRSIVRTNKRGDSGSPCLNPWSYWMIIVKTPRSFSETSVKCMFGRCAPYWFFWSW
jgi:hypothetical protein